MANVIIKTDEQRARENQILKDFGHSPNTADKAAREYAETTARRTMEAYKEMEAKQK